MTKNHFFTKSLTIMALLFVATQALAENSVRPVTDPALLAYFNKLYKGMPLRCSIDSATKVGLVARLEEKCLVRLSSAGQSYISGYKTGCDESLVRDSIDRNIDQICDRKFEQQKAEQAKLQAAQAGSSAAARSSGTANKSALGTAKDLQSTYKSLEKTSNDAQQFYEKDLGTMTGKVKEGWQDVKETFGKAKDSVFNGKSTTTASADSSEGLSGKTLYGKDAAIGPNPTPEMSKRYDEIETERQEIIRNGKTLGAEEQRKQLDANAAKKEQLVRENMEGRASKPGNEQIQETEEINRKVQAEREAELQTAPKEIKDGDKETISSEEAQARAKTTDSQTAQANSKAENNEKRVTQEGQQALEPPKADAAAAEVNCQAEIEKLESEWSNYSKKRTVCVKSANTADNFCEKLRSPGLQNVQKFITLGATALSQVNAASENCDMTSKISKVAQAGILSAQLFCTTVKFTCDTSCAAAKSQLEKVKAANRDLHICAKGKVTADKQMHEVKMQQAQAKTSACPGPTCGCCAAEVANEQRIIQSEEQHIQSADKSVEKYEQLIAKEEEAAVVTDVVADGKVTGKKVEGGSDLEQATIQCKEKNKADIVMMGMQAYGLFTAYQDAKKCKEQLTSASGSGSKSSALAKVAMSTAEFCSNAANANSLTCKCTNDPNADGCIGSVAKGGFGLGKIDGKGGASAFASARTNSQSALPGGLSSLTGTDAVSGQAKSGLSDAAREALGLNSNDAGSGGYGSGAGNANSLSAATDAASGSSTESKPGFFSKLESLFKGSTGNSKKPVGSGATYGSGNKSEQEKLIRRKIASDRLRSEISTASGKSNFDKVRSRYQFNAGSFEQ